MKVKNASHFPKKIQNIDETNASHLQNYARLVLQRNTTYKNATFCWIYIV